MSRFRDGYSWAIAVVKIILPLVALGILSTLFLLSRPIQTGQPIPFSDVELDELARMQRLGSPVHSALTDDGGTLRMTAARVIPRDGNADVLDGVEVMADVTRADGYRYFVTGSEGTLDLVTERADLSGGVEIVTSDGYVIEMPAAWLRTDLTYLQSIGPVTARGPIGTLRADGLTMTGDGRRGRDGIAIFTGRVKLVYDPQGAVSQ